MCPENGGSLLEKPSQEPQGSVTTDGLRWFALQVRCRSEFAISSLLKEKGFPILLPFYRCRKARGSRMELRELPLFAGYVFCQFDPLRRLPIITTPGVIHIVGLGKTPVPVENSEIEALQHITRAGVALQPCDYLKVGNKVRIEEGPLKGVEGILIDKRNSRRLVVSVTLLKRSVAVEVGCESVSMLETEGSGRIIGAILSGSDCASSNRLQVR